MMLNAIIIGTTLIAGALGFIGALLLFTREKTVRKTAHFFLSFAVGAMLGAVFFDLLPETFELHSAETSSALILVGILFSFIIEKLILVRHCHKHGIEHEGDGCGHSRLYASAALVTMGDFIHNFLDGVMIATSFLVSIPLGISVAIAEIAHELPQEIGDFSVLIASGMKRGKVLLYNIIAELGSVLGAILVIFLAGLADAVVPFLLPIAAGGFLYIALSDLVPELHLENAWKHALAHVLLIACGLFLIIFVGQWTEAVFGLTI